jgi:3-oxoadipate enol-lactonase
VTPPHRTADTLAHDRFGPTGDLPVLLLHAGVCDRRMWEPVGPGLGDRRDVVRVDLRGFGDSVARPDAELSHADDVAATLAHLGVTRAHVVGASLGAGVAVELALTYPDRVASLLLAAPGGPLIPELTPQLREFALAEVAALEAGDLDAAVAANLTTWVDGPGQPADRVDPEARRAVATMQRRAFELTLDWDDVEERDVDALERLGEIGVPTLVLTGGLDLDAIRLAADAVLADVSGAREVCWQDVAHLPSLERPGDFVRLVGDWLTEVS